MHTSASETDPFLPFLRIVTMEPVPVVWVSGQVIRALVETEMERKTVKEVETADRPDSGKRTSGCRKESARRSSR
jgi:hypothetical protein